jgi:hypothetical protein
VWFASGVDQRSGDAGEAFADYLIDMGPGAGCSALPPHPPSTTDGGPL